MVSLAARTLTATIVIVGALAPSTLAEVPWPDFRGPNNHGIIAETNAPTSWSEDESVAWKVEVPGKGWSSPIVVDNEVWMTTAIETKLTEEEYRQLVESKKIARQRALAQHVSLRVVVFSRETGSKLDEIVLFEVDDPEAIHTLNSYASPSPVADEGRLFCHFGRYGTACIDTKTREVKWKTSFPIEHYVGPGSSPALAGDKLLLPCDGANEQFVVAVNAEDGAEVWRQPRPPIRKTEPDLRKSYCTPLVCTVAGRRQAIIPGAQWVISYDPDTGKELWRVDHGVGFSLVARPVLYNDHVYICTGFSGMKLMAIDARGSGDVTDTHVKWTYKSNVPNQPSPVLIDGLLFMVNDSGIGQCIDVTGEEAKVVWKKRMGGKFSASPFVIGKEVYFVSREGVTTVMPTDGENKIVRKNQLTGTQMATPAVLASEIFLRTETHLYCIR